MRIIIPDQKFMIVINGSMVTPIQILKVMSTRNRVELESVEIRSRLAHPQLLVRFRTDVQFSLTIIVHTDEYSMKPTTDEAGRTCREHAFVEQRMKVSPEYRNITF